MSKKFNYKDWKNKNVVMHCKTHEEAKDFCSYFNLLERSYSIYLSDWNEEKENTCFNFNNGFYSNYNYYKERGYIILEWSDFMEKKTPRQILQQYDIITTRSGEKYMYYADKNIFVNSNGFNRIDDYNENLQMIDNDLASDLSDFDVIEISRPLCSSDFVERNWRDAKSVWERSTEVEEMTLEEICAALGKEIKIVKSKENK